MTPLPHTMTPDALLEQLREAIHHFDHLLPGQAPIKDFVHHNTLHGFQQLEFSEALAAAERVTGIHGYLSQAEFHLLYGEGRIDDADLDAVIANDPTLEGTAPLSDATRVTRAEVVRTALRHPLQPIAICQLNWEVEEMEALTRCQRDVGEVPRQRLISDAGNETAAVSALWVATLAALGLEHYIYHPEALVDLSPEEAERMLSQLIREQEEHQELPLVHFLVRKEAVQQIDTQWERVGDSWTLGELLKSLTGESLLESLRPYLIRHLAAYLDQGAAAWHNPERAHGFYHAWRESARQDLVWLFDDLPDWSFTLDGLADDPFEVIVDGLRQIGIPEARWIGYLQRLALELPGWSGMFLWRHNHPGYAGAPPVPVEMLDYLAVRLVLERLFAQRICRRQWQLEANLDILRGYFRRRRSEFSVRYTLFNAQLPEYLASQGQWLVERSPLSHDDYPQWQHLADMVWTWHQAHGNGQPQGYSVANHGWRLFRLAQHLGLTSTEVSRFDGEAVAALFALLDGLDENRAGFLWLQAYEHHYREQLFAALAANHGRGRWADRRCRPSAQLVFCMDDREEGLRRHLEERNPTIETLGAAAHFNVPNFFRGLDDEVATGLTPVVLVPSHEVDEHPRPGQEGRVASHRQRRRWRTRLIDLLFQETRRNLFSSALLIALAAPGALLVLVGKSFVPLRFARITGRLRHWFDREGIATELVVSAAEAKPGASPDDLQLGFTDREQVDRVEAFLQNIGLVSGFAPLVVINGHGSFSQNNPHLAAYDCGACSGRHSGPNARILAAMANRAEVRSLLAERDITLPDDCWFIGAEHNTCDEGMTWYDLDRLPHTRREAFAVLREALHEATIGSAHERARRFASAPDTPSRRQAVDHIAARAVDFSQARPELGHATNAAALIGRRAVTQGAFFDRRLFLISYDPSSDPDGTVLERLLLANGPVGAGINLEYYFSTINNERYGCGSKITHNVTGLFGVMDGTSSDLRTGLPRQMIEIHEAMRLQVVVEATVEQLTAIYLRQPPLQELIGNGWLLLSAIDPVSGALSSFRPGDGFVPWQGCGTPLPEVDTSSDWYAGQHQPLPPALIRQPSVTDHG